MSHTSPTGRRAGHQPAEKQVNCYKTHDSETGPTNTVSIPQDYLTDKLHATDNVRENRAAAVRQTDGRTQRYAPRLARWRTVQK
jgi:hypothetical protein